MSRQGQWLLHNNTLSSLQGVEAHQLIFCCNKLHHENISRKNGRDEVVIQAFLDQRQGPIDSFCSYRDLQAVGKLVIKKQSPIGIQVTINFFFFGFYFC